MHTTIRHFTKVVVDFAMAKHTQFATEKTLRKSVRREYSKKSGRKAANAPPSSAIRCEQIIQRYPAFSVLHREIVRDILHQSDVLVIISGDGSFNSVINEVMASSRPNTGALACTTRKRKRLSPEHAFSKND